MIITGLESQRYFLNNPARLFVSDIAYGVNLKISIGSEVFEFFYTPLSARVDFDVAKLVRDIVPRVVSKKTMTSPTWEVDGRYFVRLFLEDMTADGVPFDNDIKIVDLIFVDGGKLLHVTDVSVPNNLNVGNVFYMDYPNYSFSFTSNNIVGTLMTYDVMNSYDDVVHVSNLQNPLFLIFRNNKGGFSRLLFETFNFVVKGGNEKKYLLKNNIAIDKQNPEGAINAKTQLKRLNYEVAENLINSNEIYIFNKDIFDTTDQLIRVSAAANSDINYLNQTTDFNINLEIIHNFTR